MSGTLPELMQHYRRDVAPITDTLDQKGRAVSDKARVFREAMDRLVTAPSNPGCRADVERALTDIELGAKEVELLARKSEVNIDAFLDEVFLKHVHTGRQDAPFVARHRLPGGDGFQAQDDDPALFVDNPELDGAEPPQPRHTANIRRFHLFTTPDQA